VLFRSAAERDNNDGGPPQGGEFMLAMDPNLFGNKDGWLDHCEKLFTEITTQDGVRLPGDRRRENRENALQNGIEMPMAVYEKIIAL